MKKIVIHGNIIHTPTPEKFEIHEDSYLVAVDNKIEGIYSERPELNVDIDYFECAGQLVMPGLSDLHIHAPQNMFRGLGMDMELLDWLNVHTFPEESRYADLDYASQAYIHFVHQVRNSATTRLNVFATLHRPATELLMKYFDQYGIACYVGKVNMDRNGSDTLQEESAKASLEDTERFILETQGKYENVKPMITPRFTPSCSDELMEGLGELSRKYHIPVQSHLSENMGEIAWVKELCPWSECYGDTYEKWGLLGGKGNEQSVMAHCVHSADSDKEYELIKNNGTYIAHSPQSNTNLASGVAPIRKYMEDGLNVGLASDVAGGSSHCIFRAMVDAIQASKLRWRLKDDSLKPLTIQEAFYLGSKGGGSFFGKVGSFEPGYELDAIVIDDTSILRPIDNPISERIERLVYLAQDNMIVHKFVAGKYLF